MKRTLVLLAAGCALALAGCESVEPDFETVETTSSFTVADEAGDDLGKRRPWRRRTTVCYKRPNRENYRPVKATRWRLKRLLRKGAVYPWSPDPRSEDMVFDETCQPVPACPCFDASDIREITNLSEVWYENVEARVQGTSTLSRTALSDPSTDHFLQGWESNNSVSGYTGMCHNYPAGDYLTYADSSQVQTCRETIKYTAVDLKLPCAQVMSPTGEVLVECTF